MVIGIVLRATAVTAVTVIVIVIAQQQRVADDAAAAAPRRAGIAVARAAEHLGTVEIRIGRYFLVVG